MKVTVFPDEKAQTARELELEWAEFVDTLRKRPPRERKAGELIKCATFGERRSPKNALRWDENVLKVTGVEVDYDGGKVTPEEAVAMLERHHVRAVVVTSWSHRPERPRWRVYAPLSMPHTPLARERYVRALDAILGNILTIESYALSQSYYIDFPANGHRQVLPTFGDPSEGVHLDDLETLDELVGAIDVDDERPRKGSRAELHKHRRQAREWIRSLPRGEPCSYVGQLAADVMDAARRQGPNKSAHLDTAAVVFALLRAGEQGHPGVPNVLARVRPVFIETVTTKRANPPSVAEAEGEFSNFELDAAAKVLSDPGEFSGWGCDCGDAPSAHSEERRTDSASADDEEEDGWPESPRVPGPPEPDPIPLEGLPRSLLDAVRAVAVGTQTSPAFVLWQALGCISAALRGRYDVRVDDRPWVETGVLMPISILPSGARKSPPFKLLTRAITRWELDQRDHLEEQRRNALDRARQARSALEREIKKGGEGLEAENDVKKLRAALTRAEQGVPVLPRVRASDATSEALALLMRDQGGSIALLAPEGDPLKVLAGRYGDDHDARLELLKDGLRPRALRSRPGQGARGSDLHHLARAGGIAGRAAGSH